MTQQGIFDAFLSSKMILRSELEEKKIISCSTQISSANMNINSKNYSLIQYKGHNSKFKFFDGVQFRKYFISLPAFYLIIWLMESPKNFEKTSILKI